MKIFVGSDHAGFGLKNSLIPYLENFGHEVIDKGSFEYEEGDDYNEYVVAVAKEVAIHPNEVKGIVIGGSGQGEAMCANRFRFVRATVYYGKAQCVSEQEMSIIKLSREHNNSNVLTMGARFITEEDMKFAVKEWLETPFDGGEKYQRRIDKMDRIHD